MHVISARQFDPDTLQKLFVEAEAYQETCATHAGRRELAGKWIGESLYKMFYEPSTRTSGSFGAAAIAFGMGLDGTENAEVFSSAVKGETLEDSIRSMGRNHSIIVLRHKEKGAAARAAAVSKVPIVNAGDGTGEHPTQALLDLYTIQHFKNRLNDLNVVVGGDLKHGRTARSLAQMLTHYPNNKISFVSVPELQIGEDITDYLDERGVEHTETVDMYSALREADVVYWTRLQKERLENPESVPKEGFKLDQAALSILPENAIIMHPLPRQDEIPTETDDDPRAVYFPQAENGKYVRMALVSMILNETCSDT